MGRHFAALFLVSFPIGMARRDVKSAAPGKIVTAEKGTWLTRD
jgi:hypothetical protein